MHWNSVFFRIVHFSIGNFQIGVMAIRKFEIAQSGRNPFDTWEAISQRVQQTTDFL